MPEPSTSASASNTDPVSPVSATVVIPDAKQRRSPVRAASTYSTGVRVDFSSRSRRIQAAKSGSVTCSKPVSSRWVWVLMRPGSITELPKSSDGTPAGRGTSRSPPAACTRPSSPIRMAPCSIARLSTGSSQRAERRHARDSVIRFARGAGSSHDPRGTSTRGSPLLGRLVGGGWRSRSRQRCRGILVWLRCIPAENTDRAEG